MFFQTRKDNDGCDDSNAGVGCRTLEHFLSFCCADMSVRDGIIHNEVSAVDICRDT